MPASASVSDIATPDAARLIKRLCTHWAHKFEVVFDDSHGRVPFDANTLALLDADDGTLHVRIEAADAERLARMQDVVAEHLQRMNRGAPLAIAWRPADA